MKFWIGAFLLFATSLGLHAQALLSGRILFTQGAQAASGWVVVLTTSPNVQEFRTNTDAEGRFRFENLPSGLANLTVTGDEGLYVKTIHELWINAVKPNELTIEIEPVQVLGEAVVTADAFRSTNESPLSIKAIGWAEMQRMPGAVLDLSKVIQSFPGILPKPSFGYAISLRGGSPAENGYRFDGIDVPTISHVINFGLPMKPEDYTHRIGRTGRAGRNGTAITIAQHSERIKIRAIERFIQQTLAASVIPGLEPQKKPETSSHSRSGPRSANRNGGGGGGRGRTPNRSAFAGSGFGGGEKRAPSDESKGNKYGKGQRSEDRKTEPKTYVPTKTPAKPFGDFVAKPGNAGAKPEERFAGSRGNHARGRERSGKSFGKPAFKGR